MWRKVLYLSACTELTDDIIRETSDNGSFNTFAITTYHPFRCPLKAAAGAEDATEIIHFSHFAILIDVEINSFILERLSILMEIN